MSLPGAVLNNAHHGNEHSNETNLHLLTVWQMLIIRATVQLINRLCRKNSICYIGFVLIPLIEQYFEYLIDNCFLNWLYWDHAVKRINSTQLSRTGNELRGKTVFPSSYVAGCHHGMQ